MTYFYSFYKPGVYAIDSFGQVYETKSPPNNGDDWVYIPDPSILHVENKKFIKIVPIDQASYSYSTGYTLVDNAHIDPKKLLDHFSGCNHTWNKYTGLYEVYEYCSKCESKRHA